MSSAVDSSAWVSHLRNLSEIDNKFTERLNELKQTLSKLENSTNFNELDFSIKESEVSRTLAKLKLTKYPGLDNISNNMLKNTQSSLIEKSSSLKFVEFSNFDNVCFNSFSRSVNLLSISLKFLK
jgi:arginine repressor